MTCGWLVCRNTLYDQIACIRHPVTVALDMKSSDGYLRPSDRMSNFRDFRRSPSSGRDTKLPKCSSPHRKQLFGRKLCTLFWYFFCKILLIFVLWMIDNKHLTPITNELSAPRCIMVSTKCLSVVSIFSHWPYLETICKLTARGLHWMGKTQKVYMPAEVCSQRWNNISYIVIAWVRKRGGGLAHVPNFWNVKKKKLKNWSLIFEENVGVWDGRVIHLMHPVLLNKWSKGW